MDVHHKYYHLYTNLQQSNQDEVALTFSEVEGLIGSKLPESARKLRAWWGNRRTGKVQSVAWMQAGYHVESLDLEQERIVFRKPGIVTHVERQGDTVIWNAELIKALRHHANWTQTDLADQLNMRQQTISEWETGLYAPKRSSSKFLTLIAERAGFTYGQAKPNE